MASSCYPDDVEIVDGDSPATYKPVGADEQPEGGIIPVELTTYQQFHIGTYQTVVTDVCSDHGHAVRARALRLGGRSVTRPHTSTRTDAARERDV